jgi:hypothetical protein
MNTNRTIKTAAAFTLAAALAACGGGGGDSSSTSSGSAGSAEGFWVGTTTTGYSARVAILEDGQAWGFYSTPTAIVGALAGSASSAGGSISGSGTDFYFPGGTVTPGTFSGTYSTKGTMNVTTSGGAQLTATYSATYDSPASVSAAAGTYTAGSGVIPGFASYATTVVIAANGATTATSSFCAGTGTTSARASGKGILDISLTFTGAGCPLTSAGAITGIAHYDAAASTLIAMGRNAGGSTGFFWRGSK